MYHNDISLLEFIYVTHVWSIFFLKQGFLQKGKDKRIILNRYVKFFVKGRSHI